MNESSNLLEFYVYVTLVGDVKTAIVTDAEQNVIGVISGDEMSNTDLLRAYSNLIKERTDNAKIYTNHRQIKYRKAHTSDFGFMYVLLSFSNGKRKKIIELAYQFVDEQDKKAREKNGTQI